MDFLSENRTSLYLVGLAALLVAGHFFYKWKHSYWKRRGINGPEPWPVVGNMLSYLFDNVYEREKEWAIKYGKVYGVYFGAQPVLIVADAEILRQISIKDFNLFPNHESSKLFNDIQVGFLIFLQDDNWKRIRAMQTPTFTSGKIKRMYKLLEACADDLIVDTGVRLKQAEGKPLNLKELYGLYTLNGIASCAYGLKLGRDTTENGKNVTSRKELFDCAMELLDFSMLRTLIGATLPTWILAQFGFVYQPKTKFLPMANKVRAIINSRRASNKKFEDYLQSLLDAKLGEKMELNEMDSKEDHHAGLTKESTMANQEKMVKEVTESIKNQGSQSKTVLNEEEIISSALFLFIVGIETTATMLQNCTYALAFHPEAQEKLYAEVSKIAEYDEKERKYVFDYDTVTSCEYLDCVVSETMRALGAVTSIDRIGPNATDYYIEKYNLKVERGSKMYLAFHSIMNNPDYWHEPEKFDPERFSAQNRDKIVPGSYCPFGIGPRHCLGMRFSLTEGKLAMAKMIMSYRFEPAPNTVYPPEPKWTVGLTNLKKPFARIIPR